jgi:TetR/AcrR family transcriptional repressor of lmrAB and yxaGH operons
VPRPDQSRDRLVATAATLLRRRGYAAMATTDVLRDSGVTSGSLYHHFPAGKEDLAVAALEASTQAVEQQLISVLAAHRSTAAALRDWLGQLAAALDADIRDGCPVAPTALESVHASERLRVAAARAFECWAAPLSQHLQVGGWPAGQAREVALVVLSVIEGALLISRTTGNTEALTAAGRQLVALLTTHP